ncbi:MAG: AAA family ATPase [Proteocatella sp.]
MNNAIVRIQQIGLRNFKNVENGTIKFPSYGKPEPRITGAEIIGIYGQNGSGKTAVVDAMSMLKLVMSGKSLPEDAGDYIFKASDTAELKFIFTVEANENMYIVFYDMELSRCEESRALVSKEKIAYKKKADGEFSNKATIMDFDSKEKEWVFKPLKNLKLLSEDDAENDVSLMVSKRMSQKNRTSFIFSDDTHEIIKNIDTFAQYAGIILALKHYANVNLFTIKSNDKRMININLVIPFSFRIDNPKGVTQCSIPIAMSTPSVVPLDSYKAVKQIMQQINLVLGTIIPGLKIDIKNYGSQLTQDGKEGVRVELVSARGELEIPLRYESDGIKKIISILSTMITMYNNPSVCMVVDELDSGIFEYLLGEILQIINENAKGQLIFTSHNLRPLEKLDADSLIFTTTNPKNRYYRFKGLKNKNNLRGEYYRSINLGGQSESLYDETDHFEICRAFKIAGRLADEN